MEESTPKHWVRLTTRCNNRCRFCLDADAPLSPDDDTRKIVRDVFRHGGYKPTGRGKPASEYLVRAAGEGKLSTINAAVDLCNVVSLHSMAAREAEHEGELFP